MAWMFDSYYLLNASCFSLKYLCGCKWLFGRPFESLFYLRWIPHTWLLFQYIFWMQPTADQHVHIQTIRAVAVCHSALHPVVSLHASKLFSVTQILIWKSQLTEVTVSREKGSQNLLSSFDSPFLSSISAPFDWYLLMPAAAHPYFMAISQMQRKLKDYRLVIEALFHRRIETSPVIWALDYAAQPGEPAEPYSAAVCLEPYWSIAVWLITESVLPFLTSWLNKYWHAAGIVHSEPTLMKIASKNQFWPFFLLLVVSGRVARALLADYENKNKNQEINHFLMLRK